MKHSFSIMSCIVTRSLCDNDPPAPLADWIININPGTLINIETYTLALRARA